jgi:hypothetical protein
MSIEKKSLLSTLKTTKKASIASGKPATNEGSSTRKSELRVKKAFLRKTAVVR